MDFKGEYNYNQAIMEARAYMNVGLIGWQDEMLNLMMERGQIKEVMWTTSAISNELVLRKADGAGLLERVFSRSRLEQMSQKEFFDEVMAFAGHQKKDKKEKSLGSWEIDGC